MLMSSSLQLLELPTMNSGGSMKLKIKISSKGVRTESGRGSETNINSTLPMPTCSKKRASEVFQDSEREKRRKMDRNAEQQCSNIKSTLPMPACSKKRASEVYQDSEREKRRKMDRNVEQQCSNIKSTPPVPTHSKKHASEVFQDSEREKRRKMDRNVKQQCSNIIKDLMAHDSGWPFLSPVDPIQYNIPDYFIIITKPMDLGTVKAKLDGNMYFDVDEFASDVRLTFANAMTYNPPTNQFHFMAKTLLNIFNQRWKSVEGKWEAERKNLSQDCVSSGKGNESQNTPCANDRSRKSVPSEEKQRLKKELGGNVIKKMQNALRKFGLVGVKEEKANLDDETLFELKKVVRACTNLAPSKVDPSRVKKSVGYPSSQVAVLKDTSTSSICSANAKGHRHSVNTPALPKYFPTDKKLEEHFQDREVSSSLASVSSRSDLKSHGDGEGVVHEEKCPGPSPNGSKCVSTEGWDPLMSVDLSPSKALRVAMLKSRFADTIIKAKQKSLPVEGGNADLQRLQQERARREKQQLQEKARIEAELKAAEIASWRKAGADLKMQRERQREAARIALEKMEKTVEFEDNLKIEKELEALCKHCSEEVTVDGIVIMLGDRPLERLGLWIKEDEEDEDMILGGDREDGEILLGLD